MIEEHATVVSLEGDYALVETQRRAACGTCESSGSCSTTVLSGLFKRRANRLKVFNPIQAKPGDAVIIGLQESAFLRVSALAYLVPIFCMLLTAILLKQLALHWQLSVGELPSIIGGLLGLIIGLYLFKWISLHRASDPDYQAVILRPAMTQRVSFP